MPARLKVPDALLEPTRAFLKSEALALRVVTSGDSAVRVAKPKRRLKSTRSVLQAGGWISCRSARAAADALGISPRKLGELLNHLNIKIRACELGCFE